MGSEFVFVVLGGILILTGVIGGGFEVRELKIPPVKWPTRIVAFLAGFTFIFMGVGTNLTPDGSRETSVLHAKEQGVLHAKEQAESGGGHQSATPENDAWLRNSLEAAVLKASDAQIRADEENDSRYLEGVVVGEAHKKMAMEVQSLVKEEVYAVSRLEDQSFQSFSVDPTGQRAEVRLTETWTTALYSTRSGACKSVVAPHRVPQSVSLERHGDRWVVSDYTTYGKSPAPTACR
jgi:hypothetical protein